MKWQSLAIIYRSGFLMGTSEENDALFDENVRRVIRNCAKVTSPIWIPVLGAIGWWLADLNSSVDYITKSQAKIEVKMDYIINDYMGKK